MTSSPLRRLAIVLALSGLACSGDDGAPSEPSSCEEGETRACYTGAADTERVGTCASGLETCIDGELSGDCEGEVTPTVEQCNGLDEDCNGELDDVDGVGISCTTPEGCDGALACVGEALGCVGPTINECGVCDGPPIIDLGEDCSNDGCPGVLICAPTGDDTECEAPTPNNCGACGPAVAGVGDPCNDGACDGTLECNAAGDGTVCAAPEPNECGICSGPPVTGLGDPCNDGSCDGTLTCNASGDDAECNAPAQNECGLCGGPPIADVGDDCVGAQGCLGLGLCSPQGDALVCDCDPQPGICREDGVFRPIVVPQAGDLIITEMMPSPSGDDADQEWFEVQVTNSVDINELELDRQGDASRPDVISAVDCMSVVPGDRLVFARTADSGLNGGLPYVTGLFTFSLVGGSVDAPGDISLVAAQNVVDAVQWTRSTNGAALQLDPDLVDPAANDSESSFCDATLLYGDDVDYGTPGAANSQCVLVPPPGQCDEGGVIRAIVKPAAGQLVINEFLANPAGAGTDGTQEWFEVVNVGVTSFDLNELGLKGNPDSVDLVSSPQCLSIAPLGFALFAHTTDSAQNGGLPPVEATFDFALAQSFGSISVLDGETVLDMVTWAAGVMPDGLSRQLDPGFMSTTDNDDPVNFCTAAIEQDYGSGNAGTPKSANECL